MDLWQAMQARHSVRQYLDRPIEPQLLKTLREEVARCNEEGDLHLQLIAEEPEAFSGFMAHYGKFSGVSNYFALVGKKSGDLMEKLGYYGERLVLFAQTLGLNTCWVALTFSKRKCKAEIERGEKLGLVISLGYGATQGHPRPSKTAAEVSRAENAPDWFLRGVEAALNAPTAVNQQKFFFTLNEDGSVSAKATGGVYSDVDLGIVKYHFELGAGKENVRWS